MQISHQPGCPSLACARGLHDPLGHSRHRVPAGGLGEDDGAQLDAVRAGHGV
jgi:hypothetical protein